MIVQAWTGQMICIEGNSFVNKVPNNQGGNNRQKKKAEKEMGKVVSER